MHILLHDFAGHPFQVELSRALAARGHRVTHSWFARDSGPKGEMVRRDNDPQDLSFLPMGEDVDYSKSNLLKRRAGDIAYARTVRSWIEEARPDVVLSGNSPTEVQEAILAGAERASAGFIYWCQDFYSIAASRLLERKLPGVGHVVGAYYRRLEKRQMRRSDRIVHITDAFFEITDEWGIARDKISVIPNWGAIDQIQMMPRDNAWAQTMALGSGRRFLYSGTLALKHNPALLEALAQSLSDPDELVLVSAGVGADKLADKIRERTLQRMRILPLQPFEVFAEVLASADVLLAVIERDAGTFSVPSKVLSYLCAGRPIVLAAPHDNLAARILLQTGAGKVVEPEDISGFVAAAKAFRNDPELAAAAAATGRAYAEANFDLSRVTDRFEEIIREAASV
ncbi:MAG: glycosyltransferase [Limimaricola sp.]|uniref:glycosyltransferase n=1 Tax=Limimaricola sp. TaxID=2211665 RepID=UPI001DFA4E3B|nr:glycosyltransferase [Limimaricola sp.]MBI1417892.1 glycosyltransferase [Limimaricola sp.]